MPGCGRCGHDLPEDARFCSGCGARVGPPLGDGEVRKTVTVLFADLAGSTALGESLDPESLRRILGRYFESVARVLERHGGTVEKFIGDAVVAIFGVPVAQEDDALRAVRAAAELRATLAELNEELEAGWGVRLAVRIGINTGEVVAGGRSAAQTIVTGDAVNVAARLEQAAAAGEILIGPGTERLVKNATRLEALLPLSLRGKDLPVPAWRLLEVFPDAPALARRLDTPMVGRTLELVQLEQAFRRAVRDRACWLFTILGAAGIGKSRVAKEFADMVADDATVLTGRCLPYGDGITFWPLGEIVRQITGGGARGGIAKLLGGAENAELVDERISEAIGAKDSTAGNGETLWAVQTLLETLASAGPVVVVLDDLQWAEPTFLELIDHLADGVRDAPVVLLCLGRLELLDLRPTWGGGKLNATTTLLGPLAEDESAELIEALVGDFELHSVEAAAARERIADAAEGNPLFIEQMLAMVNEGHFDGDGFGVPPTIQALLTARLDALDRDERELISRAALIGKEFWRGALLELLPPETRGTVDATLDRLVRRQLLAPAGSTLPREPQYRFRHLLVRDAAYRALPKTVRSKLHEAFACWLERAAGSDLGEYGVIVAYHLERAYAERVELGAVDEHAVRLAASAAVRLAAAGRTALARDDLHAAESLLTRAAALPHSDESASLELTLELADCLFELGETGRCVALLSRTIEEAKASGDARIEAYALVRRRRAKLRIDPKDTQTALRDAARAITIAKPLGDARNLAHALELRAGAQVVERRLRAAERTLERALRHAERAGDAREEARVAAALCSLGFWGPRPADEALAACRELGRRLRGNHRAAAVVMLAQAGLHALRGELEQARSLGADARAAAEELGLPRLPAAMSHVLGTIELVAGDAEAAERQLRPGYDFFGRTGELGNLSKSAALLGRALLLQYRLREADALTREVEAAAAPEDVAAQVMWRAVRARVLDVRGDAGTALRLAHEAAARAAQTDDLRLHGDTLVDLAVVLAPAAGAAAVFDDAAGVLERKGVVPAVAAVARLREELGV
ncbi:MAG TPA: adenylate/guanylate cyclase domain-containing protein [Gaiellaceae bacterium]